MLYEWVFEARTLSAIAPLLRALGRHRYLREVDLRVHWMVDRALRAAAPFSDHAEAFERRLRAEPDLDVTTRDPRLYRSADVEEVIAALSCFWGTDASTAIAHRELRALLASHDFGAASLESHAAFDSDPEEPPHPELLSLDWVLLPIEDLDSERHAGGVRALIESGEEVDVSAPICQEGPCLAGPELLLGAREGVLCRDFSIWSEPPKSYADYVLRGAAKAAKLLAPPEGPGDDD